MLIDVDRLDYEIEDDSDSDGLGSLSDGQSHRNGPNHNPSRALISSHLSRAGSSNLQHGQRSSSGSNLPRTHNVTSRLSSQVWADNYKQTAGTGPVGKRQIPSNSG